ncbi:sugar phosphate nucleotidyltransferase [Curtobacterium flaccumfaciens]|nr:sugar phosphate nucleotidyltransferase [Curtobacterium flaccumfaciens]
MRAPGTSPRSASPHRARHRLRLHPRARRHHRHRRRPSARAVRSFVEKPDLDTARSYVEQGTYLWNAGMFIARADVLLAEIGRTKPELLAGLEELAEAWDTSARGAVVDAVWPGLEKIAIDYTVAEPAAAAGRMAVVPGTSTGTTSATSPPSPSLQSGGRANNLAVLGDGARILADSSSGIVVSHSQRLISLIGVEDIVVVDTPDALLVTTSANAQRVKGVVDALKISGRATSCSAPPQSPPFWGCGHDSALQARYGAVAIP